MILHCYVASITVHRCLVGHFIEVGVDSVDNKDRRSRHLCNGASVEVDLWPVLKRNLTPYYSDTNGFDSRIQLLKCK